VSLGGGEAVEGDAFGGVGEAESLEGGEDVAASRGGGATFGEEAGDLFAVGAFSDFRFDQPEDQ